MLNYTQPSASPIVSVFPLPELQTEVVSALSSSHGMQLAEERQQGKAAGEAALRRVLSEAEQQKGVSLTRQEIREYYGVAFEESRNAWKRGETPDEWAEGWWRGLATACSTAERATPEVFRQRLCTQGRPPSPSIFVSAPALSPEEAAHYRARGQADFHAYLASVEEREGHALTPDELSECRNHLYSTGIDYLKRIGIPTTWWQCWVCGVYDGYYDALPRPQKKHRSARRVTAPRDGSVASSSREVGEA